MCILHIDSSPVMYTHNDHMHQNCIRVHTSQSQNSNSNNIYFKNSRYIKRVLQEINSHKVKNV